MKRTSLAAILGLLLLATVALAGGGPQNVLVVANGNDADSVRIAEYYVKARGIPPGNLLRLRTKVGLTTDFETYRSQIQGPIQTYLAKTGLAAHVDYIVLTKGLPISTRVPGGTAAVTACLSVMDTPVMGQTQKMPLPNDPLVVNPLNRVGKIGAFSHAREYGGYRLYLTTFLIGYTTGDSIALVDRAIEAEKAPPMAPLFVFQDASNNASMRNRFYPMAMQRLKDAGFLVEHAKSGGKLVLDRKRVMGYMSGGSYSGLTEKGIASNEYLPGAICDMLESYGAVPKNFDPKHKSQVPVTWFVKHGITGVHGAVTEPFAHSFPDALLFQRYVAGMNLAESFHSSLPFLYWRNLVIGEPLCTPFARRPKVKIDGVPKEPVTGPAKVTVTAEGPVKTLRLFVDGLLADEAEGEVAAALEFDARRLPDGEHHLLAAAILEGPLELQGWATATFTVQRPGPIAMSARRGPRNSVIVTTTRPVDARKVRATIDGAAASKIEVWDDRGGLWITPATPLPAGRTVPVELSGAATGRIDYEVPPFAFSVTAPESSRAGEPVKLEVRAIDRDGKAVESYRGPVVAELDAPPVQAASHAAEAAEFDMEIRLARAGETRIRVFDRLTDTEGAARILVRPGPPAQFTAHPNPAPAGEPFDLAVTLLDQYGNRATEYEGEVSIRFPGDLNFVAPKLAKVVDGRAVLKDVLIHRSARHVAILTDRAGRDLGRGSCPTTVFTERKWLLLGPFKGETDADPAGPAADLRPSEGRMVEKRPWRRIESRKNAVDLRAELGGGVGVSYAHLWVHLPESRKVRIHLGWGAAFTLSIDGAEVFAVKKEESKLEADRHVVRGFSMDEGWHRILLKFRHGGRTGEFSLRFSDPSGGPVRGLRRSLSRPEHPSRIEGRLTSHGRGVGGIDVVLTGPGKIRTRTLPDGRFRVGGLVEGKWRVSPGAMGFATTPPHHDVVTDGKVVTGVDFT
ncbi:MAG: TIGR03790 family protein, partial [Planctomycetota bacterium]